MPTGLLNLPVSCDSCLPFCLSEKYGGKKWKIHSGNSRLGWQDVRTAEEACHIFLTVYLLCPKPSPIAYHPMLIQHRHFWLFSSLPYTWDCLSYSCPLNKGVWTVWVHKDMDFFSIVNTAVLHHQQLDESTHAKPEIWRASCKITLRYSPAQQVGASNPQSCSQVNYIYKFLVIIY